MYINGQWIEASENATFAVTDPANGETIGTVPDGGREDLNRAVDAAQKALPDWAKLTAYKRSAVLYQAHRLMMDRKKELARTMTQEQGKPLRAAMAEVQYGADFLLWFAEEAKRVYGQTIPAPRPDQRFMVIQQPVGVVGAITPWNYPVSMVTRKVAPALAAGCTVVLKPAEATPLCAMAVFRILHEAQVPAGVVNLVTALDPAPVGEAMIAHPAVRKLSFTGSTAVGRMLAQGAADQVKRVSLELGGHAPFVVFADADPLHAAKGAVLVKFLNTGQACICPNRIYVHRDIYDTFVETFVSRASALKAGSGFDPDVRIGPLVDRAALEKVENQVADALDKGAKLLCGGRRLTENGLDKGFFYAPTVLGDVTPEMLIYRQETFGPVAPVIAFDDEARVLEMANDTHYGLAAYVYTRDLARCVRMMEGLRFGIVGINDINPTAAAAPFGGVKHSGLGREGGREGIAEYLDTKLVGFSI